MPGLSKETEHPISLTVDGRTLDGFVEPRMLLTDFLREHGHSAIHVGCEHGVCGACTIRLDGKAVRSCLLFAIQADGRNVQTAAGLADVDGELNDLQAAFRKNHGLQCGYCTPGILMSASAYLDEYPEATREDLREMLSGHICRCTGYVGIMNALVEVALKRQGKVQQAPDP